MADIKETWNRHGMDVVNGNMAGLMGDLTPAAMAKAMGLAANPIQAKSIEVKDLGGNEVEITYVGDASRRTIWSKWEETSPGKWQIADLVERQ
ncbi:MAG: hypothetical protein HY875_07105 [Chloroflexi bacterium]|nr:hypothetical protein [Chloroflexota bacterium]